MQPFTDKQIALLKTFADQAVIAIENVRLFRELKEALEQQTATSEILGVIASSPTDVQPVLDAVAENAARLCGSQDAQIYRVEGDIVRKVASYGAVSPVLAVGETQPISRSLVTGRAILDCRTVHVEDLAAEADREFPGAKLLQTTGQHTTLATPLLREGIPVGAILIRRLEVRAFTDKQIKLLETFAHQAVIAIENVRLFNELKESLEQQTATSEILGVIASSPTDVQPVLDIVAKTAAQLCDAGDAAIWRTDGDEYWLVASHGSIPVPQSELRRPMIRSIPSGRAMIDKETVHIHDVMTPESSAEFSDSFRTGDIRTILVTPLLREGIAIGAIHVRRPEVRPFSDKQIALLKTFADQAVIAIENVRLFQELKESLEQQTATSEILGVIASSPTDLQPVLDAIAQSAARVCGSDDATIRLIEEDTLFLVAHYGTIPPGLARRPLASRTPGNEAILQRKTVHISDVLTEAERFPDSGLVRDPRDPRGIRTYLVTPLLREGTPIGVIVIRRTEVKPFTDKQVALLETFAAQAVIAIENVRLFNELKESLEQQTATSEILGVIASSPTDLQPVLNVVAESAARLCEADDVSIFRIDGDVFQRWARYGSIPIHVAVPAISRDTVAGRAVVDRQTLHVHDLAAEVETEFPGSKTRQQISGSRTVLVTPLLREGVPIGVIFIHRTVVRPFSEKQITLLKTFADQAVIAIQNVRLFQEIQERNAELREALEHQTATAEVLGIISRSPTDVQPVLDAIVQSTARVCGIDDVVLRLREGSVLIPRAHFGSMPPDRVEVSIDAPHHRWMREHGALHVPDVRAQNDFPTLGRGREWRTFLAAPLRQQGEYIGLLAARRTEVRPFTPAQIKLMETFADQAVIAIENVRLFNELKEALEQQTATSEILGVIARSPTDIQPVLDVVAENAARLCDAVDGVIGLPEGEELRIVAKYGAVPVPDTVPLSRGFPAGRAVLDRKTIHIHDILAEIEEYPAARAPQQRTGIRSALNIPLLREDVAIGFIAVRRTEVRPFTDKQIALLKTFADQAVIAIENVRLFKELEHRNRQLTEALEQQTATSQILGVIASSPTDIQPVLDVVAENASRLCEAADAQIFRVEGNECRIVASYGSIPIPRPSEPRPLTGGLLATRAIIDRKTIHVHDVSTPEAKAEFPENWALAGPIGIRTGLATPLLRKGVAIGAILIRRLEVRPFTDKQIALLKTFADQA